MTVTNGQADIITGSSLVACDGSRLDTLGMGTAPDEGATESPGPAISDVQRDSPVGTASSPAPED